jgi:hypothetical protein
MALVNTTGGDPMNKSGTLIIIALLTFGIAAAAMAADTPANDVVTPTNVGPKQDQRAVNTEPPKNAGKPATHKHKKKHKPVTPAPTTTN